MLTVVDSRLGRITAQITLCSLLFSNCVWAQQIVTNGQTQTHIHIQGPTTDIATETVRGVNAFNAFSKFNVTENNTVNLHVPDAATNLLNLIYDEKSNIAGTLNSYKSGQIGGNVFFANPHGIVVGQSGVINVGSMTMTTPTQEFMDGFFDSSGNPSSIATQQLLQNNAPVNSNALITIAGRVNAIDNVSIHAGSVDVSGSIDNRLDVADIINVENEINANQVIERNGEIYIVAENDIEITGTVNANGHDDVDAGDVDIRAKGDIALSGEARLSARGQGQNSDGGNVIIFADTDASIHDNATLDASGGASGNGGFVEFSARKTVQLGGGKLIATAQDGKAGTVLIDPENLEISTDLLRDNTVDGGTDVEDTDLFGTTNITWDAGSLTLQADNKIIVNQDVVISTRAVTVDTANGQTDRDAHINNVSTADSGDLTLEAADIEIQEGAKLLTFADNGNAAGNITLAATGNNLFAQTAFININNNAELLAHADTAVVDGDITLSTTAFASITNALTPFLDVQEVQTGIAINNATIQGGLINITSNADGASLFDDNGTASTVGEGIIDFLGSVNPLAGVVLSNSTSELILNGANINASGDLTISSTATTEAKSLTPSTIVGMVYAESNPHATLSIENGATLSSADDITISSNAESTMSLTAVVIGDTVNAAFAYSESDILSTVDIDSSSQVTASESADITANMHKSHTANAAAVTFPLGDISLSAAMGFTNSETSVNVDGTVVAADSINISANSITERNDTEASSTTGGLGGTIVEKAANGTPLVSSLLSFASTSTVLINASLAGSFSYAEYTNSANANIGENATITTTGANGSGEITINATIEDSVQTSANASAQPASPDEPAFTAAVNVGTFNNSANATIASNAEVDAAESLQLNSEVILPYEITWHQINGVSDVTDKFNANLGIQNGFFTTWAGSTSLAPGVGVGGSVNVSTFNTESKARIDEGASINQHDERLANTTLERDVTVDARSLVETVNFAGSLAFSAGGSSGGVSVLNVNNVTTTEAAINDDVSLDADSLAVKAENASRVITVGVAGSGGSASSLSGTTTVVTIDNDTNAFIDNDAAINLDSSFVEISRIDLNKDGGLDPDEPQFLDSNNDGLVDDEDEAVTSSGLDSHSTNKTLVVAAEDESDVYNIAGGFAGAGNTGLGVSASVNHVTRDTQAFIGDADGSGSSSGSIAIDGDVLIAANNAGDIFAYTQAGGGSAGVAGGGATANNFIDNTAESYIDDIAINANNELTPGAVNIHASDNSNIEAVITTVAGAGASAAGASVAVNIINKNADAYIKNVQYDAPDKNSFVKSETTGSILALSESLGGAVALGAGAAIAVNRVNNNTNAYITGTANNYSAKNIAVETQSESDITNISIAASGSGGVGVGGSISSNFIDNNTSSYINNGANVVAENNIGVLASNDDRISTASGSGGIGIAGAGVGISVQVNEVGGNTEAFISGADTKVTALAKDDTDTLSVNSGELTNNINLAEQVDLATYNALDLKAERQLKDVTGLAINAASTQHIESIGVNVGAGSLGLGLIEDINVITGTTRAYISEALINEDLTGVGPDQHVDVNASNHAFINGFVGNIAGGLAGVGVAEDLHTISRNTSAYITNTTVETTGTVDVNAIVSQGISSLAVGGAGGVVGAAAGTGVLAQFQGVTEAYLSNVDMVTGSLTVEAQSDDDMYLVAGNAALSGGGAVGGSFSVGLNNSTTRAYIDGGLSDRSHLNVSGDVRVAASNDSEINNYSIGASGAGSVSVAGAVVTNIVTNTTEAMVLNTDIGDLVDFDGSRTYANSITIAANNTVEINNRAGAGAAGLAGGAGAGAVVNVLKSRTIASSNSSHLFTSGLLDISANSENTIDTLAVMVGIGGTAGIGGSVVVNLIGDNLTTEANDELDKGNSGSLTEVDGFANNNRLNNVSSADDSVITAAERDRLNSGAQGDVKDIANGNDANQLLYKTAAEIDTSTVVDAGGVNVSAHDQTSIDAITGTGGGGVVGVGGAVNVAALKANVSALIDSSSSITTGGDITVSATLDDQAGDTLDVESWAGAAGIVGLGAAVTIADINNNVNAGLAGDITANNNRVSVQAEDKTRVDAKALGAQAGAVTAGAVVSRAIKQSDVNASISDSLIAGDVSLEADSRGRVKALTQSAAGGLVASGVGADSRAEDRSTASAVTASGAVLDLQDGDLTIVANTLPQVEARAEGVNASFGVRVGVSNAFASAETASTAYLADANTVSANNVSIIANSSGVDNQDTAEARAFAAGGGLLLGIGATNAGASSLMQAQSYIGNNSMLNIAESTTINSVVNSSQYAVADGYNSGILALGFNESDASSDSSSTSFLGTDIIIDGGDLHLFAGGADSNLAKTTSGSGSLIGGSSAKASTDSDNDTQVFISNGALLELENLVLEANHDSYFDSKSDVRQGSYYGGSGGRTDNDAASTVVINISNAVDVSASNINIDALNHVDKTHYGTNVDGHSGGVVDAPAGKSTTDIDLTTNIILDDGSVLAVVGDPRDPGHLTIDAYHELDVEDRVKLDSGGVIPIAKGVSEIRNDVNDILIRVGNVDLFSVGDVAIASRSVADVDADVRVKTSGVSGVPDGETLARVDATNTVEIESNAHLRAQGDVFLGAGQNQLGQRNDFNIDADTRGWNHSLIAVSQDPEADARLDQDNRVIVENNALVEAVKDVHLIASNGKNDADGDGNIKDVVLSEIATFFSKLIGGGSVSIEKNGGSSVNNSDAGVEVQGTVKAGVQNKQYLTIRKDGTIDTNDPFGISDGIEFTIDNVDLSDKLQDDIDRFTVLRDTFIADFPDVGAAYQAEIDRLTVQRNALIGVNDQVDIYLVDGIWAQSGNINIAGEYLTGSGSIEAPGDALIQIINHSPAFLETDWLTIPEHNGGAIRFNNRLVSSNADINNQSSVAANFSNIITAGNSAESLIHVENTYNPNAPGNDPNLLAPDLFINGDVNNIEGTIELFNNAGSVNINGNLLANTVNIQAGKDIVLSFVDGSRHLGGNPQAILLDVANQSEASRVTRNLNVSLNTTGNIIAANNVYASAKILNINGLVQSGIADYDLQIDANPQVFEDYQSPGSGFNTLDWAQQDYQTRLLAGENPDPFYKLNSGGDFAAFYNAAEDRIELEEARVQGGFMQLFGQIISTGSGKLKVLDGYGRINVLNDSGKELVVNAMDAGVGVEGTIKITDTNFRTSDDRPLTTVYKRLGDQVAVFNNETVDSFGEANNLVRMGIAGISTDVYSPLANQAYSWFNKQTRLFRQYVGINRNDLGGFNGTPNPIGTLNARYDGGYFSFLKVGPFTAQQIIDELTWFCADSAACNNRFSALHLGQSFGVTEFNYNSSQSRTNSNFITVGSSFGIFGSSPIEATFYQHTVSSTTVDDVDGVVLSVTDYPTEFSSGSNYAYRVSDNPRVILQDWEHEKFTFRFYDEFYAPRFAFGWADIFTKEFSVETSHQHIVKADYDIDIEFNGYDTGLLNVQSAGDILINGPLTNRDSLVNLDTQGAIRQLSDTASVSGTDINLFAETGIGQDNAPVKTRLNGGSIDINTTSGDINLQDNGALFTYKRITTQNGDVTLAADHDVVPVDNTALIKGNVIDLLSEQGSIGYAGQVVIMDSGDDDSLGHRVTVEAATGVHIQEQTGDLLLNKVVASGGDVTVIVNDGSLLDVNTEETRDIETEQELLAIWNDMNLLGQVGVDEEAFASGTITAFENTRTSDYKTYWRYRNLQTDPSNYDPNFVVLLDAAETQVLSEQGYSATEIADLQQQRTDTYHQLHSDFGGLGNSFDENYVYTASVDEVADLSRGAVWNQDQLTFGLAQGIFNETSDTETRIEDPNIAGVNINVTVSQGVGIATGEIVIDATPDEIILSDAEKIALVSAESDDITTTETEIRIALREDVDIDASGSYTINATDHVFLGSEEDINIDNIAAGDSVQIKSGKGIFNVAAPGQTNIIGTDFVLEAGSDSIGSATAPVILSSLNNAELTARSDQDIFLHELNTMSIETLFAPGHIQLTAASVQDALDTDAINIRAKSLELITSGSAGQTHNFLDIALDADGWLTASTGGVLNLLSPDRSLVLSSITSNDDVAIEVRAGGLSGTENISVTNGGLMLLTTDSIDLGGSINVDGQVDIHSGDFTSLHQLQALGMISIVTDANAINVSDFLNAGGVLDVNAASALSIDNFDAQSHAVNLISGSTFDLQGLGVGGDINIQSVAAASINQLQAAGMVGVTTSSGAINVVDYLNAGDAVILNAVSDLSINDLDAEMNSVNLTAGGVFDLLGLGITGDVDIQSGAAVDINDLQTSGAVNINAVNSLSINNVDSQSHAVNLMSGGTFDLEGLGVGGDIDIQSGAAASLNQIQAAGMVGVSTLAGAINVVDYLNAGDTVTMNAAGDLIINDLDAQINSVNLTAGGAFDLSGLGISGDIDIQSGAAASLNQLQATGIINIVNATGDISVLSGIQANDSITVAANNGDINISELVVSDSDITFLSNGDINNLRDDQQVILRGNNFDIESLNGQVGKQSNFIIGDSNGEVNISAATGIYYKEQSGNLISQSLTSDSGDIVIDTENGDMQLGEVLGSQAVTINVAGGSLNADHLDAAEAFLSLNEEAGQLQIADLFVDNLLNVKSDVIDLPNVRHTSIANKLLIELSGNDGGTADHINIVTHSDVGVLYEKIFVSELDLEYQGNSVELNNLVVDDIATITTPIHTIVIDNGPPIVHSEATIQIAESEPFNLLLTSQNLVFTDAKVVNYNSEYIVNSFSTENSLLRLSEKRLSQPDSVFDNSELNDVLLDAIGSDQSHVGFFNSIEEGTLIYIPELLLNYSDEQDQIELTNE